MPTGGFVFTPGPLKSQASLTFSDPDFHMPYTEQVSHIASIIARPPLRGNVELALDFTGVGRPVADLFERAGLKPVVIDKGALCNSIFHYPVNMVFFTTPELLEIGDLPLVCAAEKRKFRSTNKCAGSP